MTNNSVVKAFVAAACLGILCLPVSAQSSYGSIVGAVTDPTGASIAGAAVTLSNLGTSEHRTVESDSGGNYQFVSLQPGNYKVDIEKAGFKHLTRDVEVAVLSTARVDAAMQVGDVGQTVEVSGQTALLQTENASVGQVVEERAVLELPLNGRNPMNLIELSAGVVAHGQTQGQNARSGLGNFQISGGVVGQGRILLDGVSLNTGLFNGPSFGPVQDIIQEFQVMGNNLPPEFGSTLNGVVNLATKSGSNQYHGTAYEYLRNRVLNASTFFSNRAGLGKPAFTQNQYGLNGGGPIIHDKTFIFMAWEDFSQRQGTTGTYTVPTLQERAGNFSNLRTASGAQTVIYDPATTCTTCPAGQQRTPFPGNVIPTNRFDNTASIMLKYWPLPNAAGIPFTNANNYIVNYNAVNDRNEENLRVDQNLSQKQRLFGRFTRWNNIQPPIDTYGLNVGFFQTQNAHQGMLADTYTLNSTTVLDGRMSYTRTEFTRTPTNYPFNYTSVGWPSSYNAQILQPTLPVMQVQGFSNSDSGGVLNRQFSGVGYLAGSVTKIIGRHTLKFGGEYSWLPTSYGQTSSNSFAFTQNFTAANPLSPGSTGSGLASFLLGLGNTGTAGSILFPEGTQKTGGLYAGDTFQASKRLTVNLGVRWEYPGYWSERYNQEAVFQTGATNPVLAAAGLPYKGDVVLVNSDRYPYSTQLIPHWNLFSPRFGTAYRLNDKTVARMGFGISYTPGDVAQFAEPYVAPINTAATPWVPTQNSGLTAVTTLSNPFPNGINLPPGRNPSYESRLLGQSVTVPIPGDATPYIMNWNVGFERQLGSSDLIDIAYVGTRGVHLRQGGDPFPQGGPNFNQIPSQYLSLGSQLLTPVTNPFFGLVQTGPLAQPTVPYGQLLLPFPQYTGVYSPTTSGFDEVYHSLQAKFQKQFKSGGTLLVTYSWSKNTGNGETLLGHTEVSAPGITQNYNNWAGEHSLLSYDVPQRLSVSYVVDLPIGKGKRLLGGVTGVTDKLISGWGVDGVTTLQTGFPLALLAAATSLSTNFGAGPPRPNVTAGCNKIPDGSSQSRVGQWFNTACFSQPSTFGFGSEARTDPNIRVAGIANYNLALFKNTAITERIRLQFRVESFNLFNRVQFGPPGATIGTATFGVVSTQINDPRLIQLAMRLTF